MDEENKYETNSILLCEVKKNESNNITTNKNNSQSISSQVNERNIKETVSSKNEGILVNLYHKYFKPKKTDVPNCSNMFENNNQNAKENYTVLKMQDEPKEEMKKEKKASSGFLHKFLQNKNSKIIALVGLGCLILLIMINAFAGITKQTTNNSTFNNLSYISSASYTKELETKLTRVLGKIKGAGSVDVMVTLESGPELKIAMSVDKKTNTVVNGNNTTTNITVVETPIIITQNGESKPLVLMEIMPKIKGVIIVSQGAGDVKIKLELLQAVQSILGVNGNNIQIYAGI